jgi:chromosome segregation ATPase
VGTGDLIDLDRVRPALARRRDSVERLLGLREQRRALEAQVDSLERELRGEVVAHEELRRTEAALEARLAAARAGLEELRERLRQRLAGARDTTSEFERLKLSIVELHEARAAGERELARLDDEIRRQAEHQRRLVHECGESAADLARLRRALGGVLAEVKHSLSRRTGED